MCNVTYKIISKTLANRLRQILPKIIFALQSASIPDRNIHDNILVTKEIISFFKQLSKRGYMAIKPDMKKACDRLEWNFIKRCCLDLGLNDHWIN